jgi:hypothetical protein
MACSFLNLSTLSCESTVIPKRGPVMFTVVVTGGGSGDWLHAGELAASVIRSAPPIVLAAAQDIVMHRVVMASPLTARVKPQRRGVMTSG